MTTAECICYDKNEFNKQRISSRRVISTGGIARERKLIRLKPEADSKVWMREESRIDAFF